MKQTFRRLISAAAAAACSLCLFGTSVTSVTPTVVHAAVTAEDYPVSLVQLGTADGGSAVTVSGANLITAANSGAVSQDFRFDYVGADGNGSYFRIVSASNGKALGLSGSAADGTACILTGISGDKSQLWYVTAVQNDFNGQGLYYKIANCSNSGFVLANFSGEIKLSAYTGNSSQKWLLNSAGLQGFAGYAKDMNGNAKASTIGGLLGETVEVSTFDELKNACEKDDTPRTIIITNNISKTGTYYYTDAGRAYWFGGNISIHDNKTIIGSYGAHDLYNVAFVSNVNSSSGHANNVIIRNIEISHDKDLNHHNVWDFDDGKNFWVDHCTFVGHDAVNQASTGQVDWDKFLCFYEGSDYVTISDCSFGRHKYGVLLGWPGDSVSDVSKYDGTPCVTLVDNYFHDTLTRAPGLMRYGYFHSLNNFVYNFDMGYTIYTDSKLFAEKNYYDAGVQKGSVVNDSVNTSDASGTYPGKYSDSGSYHAQGGSLANKYSSACSWRASSNYSYKSMTAQETKPYTMEHSGAKDSPDKMDYYCSDHNWAMETTAEVGAELDTTKMYAFQSVNSGLYLEVENGTAASGTNVQQGKNADRNSYLWTLEDAGDGYYYLYTKSDPNGAFCLDLPYGNAANGTSLGIWTNDKSDARKFKFIDNGDGSYTIVTKSSGDASAVAVASDSKESGADVIQWTRNGGDAQKWRAIVKYDLISGELIKNLDTLQGEYGESWAIRSGLKDGALLYGDRDVKYANLPQELVGGEYIVTPCDAKNLSGELAEFEAGENLTLYVAVDVRVTNTPSWLTDWTKTDLTFSNSSDVKFVLYAKEFSKGETMTLGANEQSAGCVNYTVIAVKSASTVGDVNGDGSFNVADVVALQRWLLADKSVTLQNWKAADLCEDGRLDVFDFCLMKRKLLNG